MPMMLMLMFDVVDGEVPNAHARTGGQLELATSNVGAWGYVFKVVFFLDSKWGCGGVPHFFFSFFLLFWIRVLGILFGFPLSFILSL